jgi:uncharacterized membrane protein YdjX (TVP38/TMEM64 family)
MVENGAHRQPRSALLLAAGFLAVVGLGLGLGYVLLELEWQGDLSIASVKARMAALGPWGPALSIALMVVHSFLPFPAEVVAMANGVFYGPLWGSAITWIGAMLGAFIAFGLTRLLGRPFVTLMIAERDWRRLDDWAARHGPRLVLVARLIPIIAFNLINYAAGLTRLSWWTFAWTTGLGILPVTILMVVLGSRMETLSWPIWVALLAGALLLWLVLRRWPPKL